LTDVINNLKSEEKRRLEKKQDKTKSNDNEQAFFSKGKQNKKPYKNNFHKGITCYNCNIKVIMQLTVASQRKIETKRQI
jgi:hypothetical protein